MEAASILHTAGLSAGYVAVALLCVAGALLSCLTFSGTWLVVLATIRGLALLAISNEEGKTLAEYWLHTRAWLVPLLAPEQD